MKLSTREDILAPCDVVFGEVADFAGIAGTLRARGVEIEADGVPDRVGASWTARYQWRGRKLETAAELVGLDPPRGYTVRSMTGGVECIGTVDLLEVTNGRTRLFATLDFRPTGLSSRVLLQSLKLAKKRLSQRFATRVARFAADIQTRHQKSGSGSQPNA